MYYRYNDINLYVEFINRNKNKNILILPGWGETFNTFYNISSYFKNYNIYIVHNIGFGNSKFPNRDLTIYNYAYVVKEFIKHNNINNLYVIAHSFGGRIASILIGKYNIKVKRLVLMDVAGFKGKSIKTKVKEIIYKVKIKLFKRKRKEIFLKYASSDYKALNENMKNTFKNIVKENLKKYYKKIKVDTLIIWGEKDSITPIKDGKKLNKLIKNSSLISFKDGSHFTYLEYFYNVNKIIECYFKD